MLSRYDVVNAIRQSFPSIPREPALVSFWDLAKCGRKQCTAIIWVESHVQVTHYSCQAGLLLVSFLMES